VTAAALCLAAAAATATAEPSTPPAPKAEILGLWKGSSICTKVEAAEFCRDETVVYNFVDVPERPATVSLKAGRIVDGNIQKMYAIYFTYQPKEQCWTSEFDRLGIHGVWTYAVHGDEMTGSAAMLPGKTVVRNVSVKRVTPDLLLPH
jgi:hypothetical protein